LNPAADRRGCGEAVSLTPSKGTTMKRIFAVLISGLLASAGALAQDSKMAAPAPATATPAPTSP